MIKKRMLKGAGRIRLLSIKKEISVIPLSNKGNHTIKAAPEKKDKELIEF